MIMLYNDFDLNEEKVFSRYIKKIEQLFRQSYSYKFWVKMQYAKRTLICPFSGINGDVQYNLLELHHHPFTLYDLCIKQQEKVIRIYETNKKYDERYHVLNQVPEFDVIRVIQDQHLIDLVPYIPLAETYHKWYHQTQQGDQWDQIEIKNEWIINLDKITLLNQFFEEDNNLYLPDLRIDAEEEIEGDY